MSGALAAAHTLEEFAEVFERFRADTVPEPHSLQAAGKGPSRSSSRPDEAGEATSQEAGAKCQAAESQNDLRKQLESELAEIRELVEKHDFDEGLLRQRTVRSAARILECHESTVRRLVSRGVLPHRRLGPRQIVIDIEDIYIFKARGVRPEDTFCAGATLKPRSVSWAEEKLGVCRRTVLKMVRDGRLRAIRYSQRRLMVDEDEVVRLAERKRPC